MKLKINFDSAKDKFYFDFEDGTLSTCYGTYAAVETLEEIFNRRVLCYVNKNALAIDYINKAINDKVEIEV